MYLDSKNQNDERAALFAADDVKRYHDTRYLQRKRDNLSLQKYRVSQFNDSKFILKSIPGI
jgi:hypothetical protein